MRKLIAILIATVMACAFVPLVGADSTDTIVVTLQPSGTVSITVSPATWGPVCAIASSNTSATDAFTITNAGSVQVNVTVEATNTEAWVLAGSASHNQFWMQYQNATSGLIDLANAPATFLSNFPSAGGGVATWDFGLKITMPTSSSTNEEQHSTITFSATAT